MTQDTRHASTPATVCFIACVAIHGLASCSPPGHREARRADLANEGGTPTIRKPVADTLDDPATSNDESNDQPLGHFGTLTLEVTSFESGNTYTLDADVDGATVERIYFPKGGWVDFIECELDESLLG